jgi:hypothetical protein
MGGVFLLASHARLGNAPSPSIKVIPSCAQGNKYRPRALHEVLQADQGASEFFLLDSVARLLRHA